MEFITVARPYARAAFACADPSQYAIWEKQLQQLATAVVMPTIAELVDHPRYSRIAVGDCLLALLDQSGTSADTYLSHLVRLLAERRRLKLLPEIAQLFKRYFASSEGRVDAEVWSAQALDKQEKKRLQEALVRRTGKQVRLHCQVDEALLGGAIIRADGMVIDGSLRHRLEKLSSHLNH